MYRLLVIQQIPKSSHTLGNWIENRRENPLKISSSLVVQSFAKFSSDLGLVMSWPIVLGFISFLWLLQWSAPVASSTIPQKPGLHFTVTGCTSTEDLIILRNALNPNDWKKLYESSDTSFPAILSLEEADALVTQVGDSLSPSIPSDMSFCFLDRNVLLNEEIAIGRIYQCLNRLRRDPVVRKQQSAPVSDTSKTTETQAGEETISKAAHDNSNVSTTVSDMEDAANSTERTTVNSDESDLPNTFTESSSTTPEIEAIPQSSAEVTPPQPKTVFLVYRGPLSDVGRVNQLVQVAKAVDTALSTELGSKVDGQVQLVLLMADESSPEMQQRAVAQRVKDTLSAQKDAQISLQSLIQRFAGPNRSPPTSLLAKTPALKSIGKGAEGIDKAVQEALSDLAKRANKDSKKLLRRLSAGSDLAQYLEVQLDKSLDQLRHAIGSGASTEVRILAEEMLHMGTMRLLRPLLSAFMSTKDSNARTIFNEESQDVDLGPQLMDELRALKSNGLRDLQRALQQTVPQHWKSSALSHVKEQWLSKDTSMSQFSASIDAYLQQRESASQLQGVLPRPWRQPVHIALHSLLLHPLGRDHRQDPLCLDTSRDRMLFNEDVAQTQPQVLVSPSAARAGLVNQLHDPVSKSNVKQLRRRSEFAREMLMFPLSIKNPDTPIASGNRAARGSKRASLLLQTNSQSQREQTGPERFIRWDIEPLDQAKVALEALRAEQQELEDGALFSSRDTTLPAKLRSTGDSLLNIFPQFAKGHYRHPPYNYGAKYSASAEHVTAST